MRELAGYYATHDIYRYKNGVWKDDFGLYPEFTKDDVKKIYADHEQECTIVLLKNGTEINPDGDICGGIYEERTEAWKQKILSYKGRVKPKAKPWRRYIVYGVTWYGSVQEIGKTSAKSPDHAVNNVRYRTYGLKLNNEPFIAFELEEREDGEYIAEKDEERFRKFLRRNNID